MRFCNFNTEIKSSLRNRSFHGGVINITEFVLSVSENRLSGQSACLSSGRISAPKAQSDQVHLPGTEFLPAWFSPLETHSASAVTGSASQEGTCLVF